MILEDMYRRYKVLAFLKNGLIKKGYNFKKISYINSQIDLVSKFIDKESYNVLDSLLREKTYCRLLKKIEKGAENIIDILDNPMEWKLCEIEENNEEWTNKESLIFSTKRGVFTFTKNKYDNERKYIDNKWQ